MAYGWAGTASEFIAEDPRSLIHRLNEAALANYGQSAGAAQEGAWAHELPCLSNGLHLLPEAADWGVVLEYELPYEGGRRPDAVVLARERVLVLEFKDSATPGQAEIDQVKAYARDLAEYHSCCRGRPVVPVLVLPNRPGHRRVDETDLVDCLALSGTLRDLEGTLDQLPFACLTEGQYAPLPSLVQAARFVWRREPLPFIRRAESAGVPQLLVWLHDLAKQAQANHERHLVLITGVPGSGKTLVGLQFVYEVLAGDEPQAVFLSGNDPLVAVLQDALQSKVFVRRWRDFDTQFGKQGKLSSEHVLVFDEAQRAWDRQRMLEKHGIPKSEPQLVAEALARMPDWGLVIGLVGEGQEIYLGEEAGLGQWVEAVRSADAAVSVHVPTHLASVFGPVAPTTSRLLNLTLSLRTHRADNVQDWVAAVIDGRLPPAARLAPSLHEAGYDLYVTDDLPLAKQYLIARYAGATEKHYGLLASSKARNLRELGVDNEFNAMQRVRIGPWFNTAASDPRSGCQLSQPVTEFQCQGLELDMPIVCWGDDLGWEGDWVSYRRTTAARDSHQLRLNSYRVLLSRGRDGQIIYVPRNLPRGQSQGVLNAFLEAGAIRLPRDPTTATSVVPRVAETLERRASAPASLTRPAPRPDPAAVKTVAAPARVVGLGSHPGGLVAGQPYARRALHVAGMGGNWQKGISYPARGDYVLLFSSPTGRDIYGYNDHHESDEIFEYFGEWSGAADMAMTGGNLAITERSRELYLFTSIGKGMVRFEGRFELLEHRSAEAERDGRRGRAIVFRLRRT